MTSGRRAGTALHLFLVWATMSAAVPVLGFGLLAAAWGGGAGMAAPLLLLGVPLTVGLLATAGVPVRTVVPSCSSARQRIGWAVLVFVLGTAGVLAGVAAYGGDVDLGSAGTRFALTGVPYAVAAAFFVPGRWVRLGAVAVLAAGVAYGGFLGPAQARQRQHEAEVARYREHAELLYIAPAPSGMQVSRATAGPASFSVEYRSARQDEFALVGLTVRSLLMPTATCSDLVEKDVTCRVDVHGEMRTVRDLPGGGHGVTLTRRHPDAEFEVTSQTLDEAGLRRLLNSVHPLSDAELEKLMREGKVDRQL
ncbi:hypothetical protein ABZY45_18910 [Streptomyces sp. NPDC006516]|uniref:hypothetical protein n=1 Tax=Streptomyces sp. NPDC006516 TaxID=3154309 RepID=UPI0033A5B61B